MAIKIQRVHVDGVLAGERGIGGLLAKAEQSGITEQFQGKNYQHVWNDCCLQYRRSGRSFDRKQGFADEVKSDSSHFIQHK